MTASPAAIIRNDCRVSCQVDNRRSDLKLLGIDEVPHSGFRTQLDHRHGLLKQLRRDLSLDLSLNLLGADFVFRLFGRGLKQTVRLIHQHPIMSLPGQRGRSTLRNNDVGHFTANDLVGRQRQTGRSQDKQSIGHGLLQLHHDARLPVAQIFPGDSTLAGDFESHDGRDASREFDGKMIGCGPINRPVQSHRDLDGRLGHVGDSDGSREQHRNSLPQLHRQRAGSSGVALKCQRRRHRRDFLVAALSRGGRFDRPVAAVADAAFKARILGRGVQPDGQLRCGFRRIHHGWRHESQQAAICIAAHLSLHRDLQQSAACIGELNAECP